MSSLLVPGVANANSYINWLKVLAEEQPRHVISDDDRRHLGQVAIGVQALYDRIAALEQGIRSILHFNGDCVCSGCVRGAHLLKHGE